MAWMSDMRAQLECRREDGLYWPSNSLGSAGQGKAINKTTVALQAGRSKITASVTICLHCTTSVRRRLYADATVAVEQDARSHRTSDKLEQQTKAVKQTAKKKQTQVQKTRGPFARRAGEKMGLVTRRTRVVG